MTGRRAKLWAFVFNAVRKHGANEARILAAQEKIFGWRYQARGGIVVRTTIRKCDGSPSLQYRLDEGSLSYLRA